MEKCRAQAVRADNFERGAKFRDEQLAHSAVLMRANLDALAGKTLAEIHAAAFELWDECTEDDAGQRARMQVIGWIAAHCAAGTPAGFTADELAAFDAKRTSTQHFAPYSQ